MIHLSTSKVRLFKECRKKYFFKYVQQIEQPKTEALLTGTNYHESISNMLLKKEYNKSYLTEAFNKYILPNLPEIKETEIKFEIKLAYGVRFIGVIDAMSKNDEIIEHKTTSKAIDEKYIHDLNWDEQVTSYLMAKSLKDGILYNKVIYTAIQKPTIRLKQNETQEEYLQRCYDWYSEEKAKTFKVYRNQNEIQSWQDELIFLAKEIKQCKNFYRNPNACYNYKCEYSGYCLDYSMDIK